MAVFWYYLPEGVATQVNAKCGKIKAECEETAAQDLCRQLGRRQLPDGTLLVRWSDDCCASPSGQGNLKKGKPANQSHAPLVWKDPLGCTHVMTSAPKYAM